MGEDTQTKERTLDDTGQAKIHEELRQRAHEQSRKRVSIILLILGLLFLLCLSIILSISVGSANLSPGVVWRIILAHLPIAGALAEADWPASSETIVMQIRFPRIVLAVLVGAALAASGVAFQGILHNPLADPYILGVSSGASMGVALVIVMGWQWAFGEWTIPMVAFLMGLFTLAVVYRLARVGGHLGGETLILSGVVVQAFLGALLSFFLSISEERMQQIVYWLMGSLALKDWAASATVFPFLMIGWVVLFGMSKALNLLALGDAQAAYLGVPVQRIRALVMVVATLMTAAAVSVSGTIGFVGLVIPHLVRLIVGSDHRLLIPLATLAGAIFMVWADTFARMVLAPRELPIGVITALLGAPFFAYLLRRDRKRRQKVS